MYRHDWQALHIRSISNRRRAGTLPEVSFPKSGSDSSRADRTGNVPTVLQSVCRKNNKRTTVQTSFHQSFCHGIDGELLRKRVRYL